MPISNLNIVGKAVRVTDFVCILSTQEPQPWFPTPTSPIEASEWEGLQQCTQNQKQYFSSLNLLPEQRNFSKKSLHLPLKFIAL
jgi:hypothetical protein